MITEPAYQNRPLDDADRSVLSDLRTTATTRASYTMFGSSSSKDPASESGSTKDVPPTMDWRGARADAETDMRKALSGLASIQMTPFSFRLPSFGPPVRGDSDRDDILSELIRIIMSVVQLPKRFANMFQALTKGAEAVAKSFKGIGKSVELATRDIFTLIIAVVGIVFKYWLCIVSFVVTTMGGCFLIHGVTFACYVLYFVIESIASFFGVKPLLEWMMEVLSETDDQLAEITGFNVTKWPKAIRTICYTCFGKPVKLRDVSADLGALSDIGDTIAHDFNQRIPYYMRDAIPPGKMAISYMDRAMN
jgi:hypothetical protein